MAKKYKKRVCSPRIYKPDMDVKAKVLAAEGLTEKQLGDEFGVTRRTIYNWKKRFPLFCESIMAGKKISDAKVVAALYQRAVGYSCPDVHISNCEGDVTLTPIIKHYPPDTTAQIFWLKNRKPDEWRDKHEVDGRIEILPPMIK